MAKEDWSRTKKVAKVLGIGAVGFLVASIPAVFLDGKEDARVALEHAEITKALEDANGRADALQEQLDAVPTAGEGDNLNQQIFDKLVEEDVFEVTVEETARAELEKRGFKKDLAEALEDAYRGEADYKDIEDIDVRDVDVSNIDLDEGEAEVTLDLRVNYYNGRKDVKRNIEVTFTFEENEIDDTEFNV